jgi:hypothetical protein
MTTLKTEDILTTPSNEYFFVDESGDPNFYNRYGKLIVGTE